MTHLRELPITLARFARDPIGSVRHPVDFSWLTSFILIAFSALVSGAVNGTLTHNRLDFLISVTLYPVIAIITSTIFGLFIYYFFSLFKSTFLDFRRLMSLVAIALLPYFLCHSLSSFLAPIDLLGFAFTSVLLIVGLVEQFALERRICVRLVAGLAILYFVMWSLSQIRTSGQI